jgi:hypothetical protein
MFNTNIYAAGKPEMEWQFRPQLEQVSLWQYRPNL